MKKLSLLYTVWTGDDMEMLKESIEHHKIFVDEIVVCFQMFSNMGECVYCDIPSICESLGVKSIEFHPDLNLNTKENERIKHNQMIQYAKENGSTHFILCACDHFYDKSTFENAKRLHGIMNLDVTFTKMITYYKRKDWVIYPLESYYMPFIHKIHPDTSISKNANYPVLVDPSVKVNTYDRCYVMKEKDGVLHHYSMVRKDIKKKFRNAASSIRWKPEQIDTFISEFENAKLGDKITYFKGGELVDVGVVLKVLFG